MIGRTTDMMEKSRSNDPDGKACAGIPCGRFFFPHKPTRALIHVIAHDGREWDSRLPLPAFEHVSVSVIVSKIVTVPAHRRNDPMSFDGLGPVIPATQSPQIFSAGRCPTWEEMCYVKDVFWRPDEMVLQYHPPIQNYVNQNNYVLHLWKPIGVEIPLPPDVLVGTTYKSQPDGRECHGRMVDG